MRESETTATMLRSYAIDQTKQDNPPTPQDNIKCPAKALAGAFGALYGCVAAKVMPPALTHTPCRAHTITQQSEVPRIELETETRRS